MKTYCCEQDCVYIQKNKVPCSHKEVIVEKAWERIKILFDSKYPICPYYWEENK